jgi:hypothetical protein
MNDPVRVPIPVTGEPITLNTEDGSPSPTEVTPLLTVGADPSIGITDPMYDGKSESPAPI